MRDSLKRSLENSPSRGWQQHPKGSIVLCNACVLPIFKLDRAVVLADKCGRAASAFKPLSLVDLDGLALREDIDAGLAARLRGMSAEQRRDLVSKLREVRAGDPMTCPVCGDCFVQVVSVDRTEALERSFTVELVAVPPQGHGTPPPIRGKSVGFGATFH